ncbi:MAG: SPOR domain-containing protein [Rhodoferax sp.]|nr:SPOR domain-containing protein [Rhodoferax sp.]MCB2029871.1 SPOR domain-containing protein [Rhodoferax sp.]
MALFKFRKGRDEQPAPSKKKQKPAPTVEAVRRRAMHRLIGAAVLVLAAVIGFPLIFDNQPRPIPVDLPIEIVDRNKVKPLVLPPAAPAAESVAGAQETAPAPTPAAPAVAATPTPAPAPAPAATTPPATTAATAPAPPKAAAEVPEIRALDAKKARALLEGRTPADQAAAAPSAATRSAANDAPKAPAKAAAASDDRYVVQIGAFADAAKVRDVRRRVEAAGLKTYTQVVGTSEGDRTRVRVGPFSDRAEADKAAEKIRKLKLTAAILTL